MVDKKQEKKKEAEFQNFVTLKSGGESQINFKN